MTVVKHVFGSSFAWVSSGAYSVVLVCFRDRFLPAPWHTSPCGAVHAWEAEIFLMRFADIHILAIQGRILAWVGLVWLGVGLWLEVDPLALTWRACLGAWLAMVCSGILLRIAWHACEHGLPVEEGEPPVTEES
ncbi:MAG: hypothetical protein SVT56_10955, partial [Chloroflexota bacterium]|nr:hypothetical protein [Chloroflexota bacterium]